MINSNSEISRLDGEGKENETLVGGYIGTWENEHWYLFSLSFSFAHLPSRRTPINIRPASEDIFHDFILPTTALRILNRFLHLLDLEETVRISKTLKLKTKIRSI